ncbi:hypothetical protein BpHYR1_006664 [Brachionus plicatilis]|uniref:Uncharacterized protein n=1 Tax=Brachionus plicatilis TaxID=10195 RepID=A0A3M7QPV4_BRAPC|nr:hypothetical protein BpHYR1_006664 [Brachionus plicatilis]
MRKPFKCARSRNRICRCINKDFHSEAELLICDLFANQFESNPIVLLTSPQIKLIQSKTERSCLDSVTTPSSRPRPSGASLTHAINKKRSNAGLQFANSNELLNGTPEKVRQDYLEKSAIKSEPTNKWRNDDQIGFSGNSRGRSFPNTGRNLYSSSGQEHHGLKSLLEPIKTHNAFGESWREPLFIDSLEDNVVFPKYRRRDASWDTPIGISSKHRKI